MLFSSMIIIRNIVITDNSGVIKRNVDCLDGTGVVFLEKRCHLSLDLQKQTMMMSVTAGEVDAQRGVARAQGCCGK